MVWPWCGFVDGVSDEIDVGGRLSVVLAEVKKVHVTVKGHGHGFIANSLSDLLDQFLLRRQQNRYDVSLESAEPVSTRKRVEFMMKLSVRFRLVRFVCPQAPYTHLFHCASLKCALWLTGDPFVSRYVCTCALWTCELGQKSLKNKHDDDKDDGHHQQHHHHLQVGTVQLKCDGTRWRTGGEVKGKLANAVCSQYPSHYLGTWCIQHHYRWCAHLGCQ